MAYELKKTFLLFGSVTLNKRSIINNHRYFDNFTLIFLQFSQLCHQISQSGHTTPIVLFANLLSAAKQF